MATKEIHKRLIGARQRLSDAKRYNATDHDARSIVWALDDELTDVVEMLAERERKRG